MKTNPALAFVSLEGEFTLDGGQGHYQRTIEPSWGNSDERIFGGYTTALCFAAAARESLHPALCSGHVIFLEAAHTGRIDFEVNTLRKGRSVAAMQVSGIQDGRRVLICQTWLRSAPTEQAAPGAMNRHHGPDGVSDLAWLSNVFGFHGWFESLGVDYPRSMEEFSDDRKRTVDVWSRPKAGQLPHGTMTQLFDVLIADAYMADSHMRSQPCDPAHLVSLDLAIQWTPLLHRTGWRRIQAESPPVTDGSAACIATISDESGTVCATASQQTWNLEHSTRRVKWLSCQTVTGKSQRSNERRTRR
jgi:acyl-CoA thioesterase